MDHRTEQAHEATLQDELLRNERVVFHPTLGNVRLKRPTPGEERMIAEERRRQYHKDMKNEEILSRAELETLAVRRGMWSKEIASRIEELMRKTGEAMGLLEAIGFKSLDTLMDEFQKNLDKLLGFYAEAPEVREAILRYFNLELKGSPKDRSAILDAAPSTEVDDLLDLGDALRTQIDILHEMFKVRKELRDLKEQEVRLFVDSIEMRADRVEELARIYHCAVNAETGKPLWPHLADIDSAPPHLITFLTDEMSYFLQGVTPELKETLGKYGFIKRQSDTNGSSDDSPVLPPPNSDGESAASDLTASSPVTE